MVASYVGTTDAAAARAACKQWLPCFTRSVAGLRLSCTSGSQLRHVASTFLHATHMLLATTQQLGAAAFQLPSGSQPPPLHNGGIRRLNFLSKQRLGMAAALQGLAQWLLRDCGPLQELNIDLSALAMLMYERPGSSGPSVPLPHAALTHQQQQQQGITQQQKQQQEGLASLTRLRLHQEDHPELQTIRPQHLGYCLTDLLQRLLHPGAAPLQALCLQLNYPADVRALAKLTRDVPALRQLSSLSIQAAAYVQLGVVEPQDLLFLATSLQHLSILNCAPSVRVRRWSLPSCTRQITVLPIFVLL